MPNTYKQCAQARPLHSDYVAIFCHQFDAWSSGMASDIALVRYSLPFGFSASPAIFATRTEVIQRAHHITQGGNGARSGWGPLHSYIFADDAIFVETDMGNILRETVEGWGPSRRSLFGDDSISDDKTRLEGDWNTKGLVLCCDLDDVEETIAAPQQKIEGGRIYIVSGEFVVGIQHVCQKAMQTIRGYMRRWSVYSLSWASCVQPVDLLLAYGSADCATINCANF